MIDIIIPAYNSHNTIYNCLFSVLNQSIVKKLNVYLIDDCSDNKYDDVYNFFKDKLNIKIIRLDSNRGPGYARQIGINKSNSDYIIFLDSDDVFYDSYSVENIYKEITSTNSDLVFSNMVEKNGDELIDRYGGIDSLHSKIYKREFIINNNIIFPNTYNSEDVSFNHLFLLNKPIVSFCSTKVYAYRRRKNSLTMTEDYRKNKHIKCYCDNLIWVLEYAKENNINPDNIGELLSFSFSYLYYYFTFKISIEDKSIKHVYKLIPYYLEYFNNIKKETQNRHLEEWISNRDKYRFDFSFNEFINVLKKGYEEVKK